MVPFPIQMMSPWQLLIPTMTKLPQGWHHVWLGPMGGSLMENPWRWHTTGTTSSSLKALLLGQAAGLLSITTALGSLGRRQ